MSYPLFYWTILIAGCRFELRHERKNPIDHARFYKKGNPDLAIEIKKEQVDVFVIPLYCFLLVRITSFNFNSLNYSLHHLGV